MGWFLVVLAGLVVAGLVGVVSFRGRSKDVGWRERVVEPGLTGRQFTQLYIEALRERIPEVEARIVGDLLIDAKTEDWERRIHLANLWRRCCQEKDRRVELVEYYVNGLPVQGEQGRADGVALDLESLVPVIKDSLFLEQFGHVKDGAKPYFGELIAGDIWVMYGLDHETGIKFISEEAGKALGMSFEELREKAKQNLRRLLPTIKIAGGGPVFIVMADGTYEASFLLFDGVWEEQAQKVEGDVVAAIPSRDMLMFTGSESEEGLLALREAVQRVYQEMPYAVSETLLVRRDGRWEVFEGGL